MKLHPLRGLDRKRAIEARTLAVWESSTILTQHQRRYLPRAYNSAGNWYIWDVDEQRALTDDDLLRISVRRLIETPCRAPTPPAPLPDQTPAKP